MTGILSQINSPADLRQLPMRQLEPLAAEIRELILQTVAKNGGHLAANLGVVEMTVALHYAFDTPRDTVVWDVGHQCYAHKILTGRRDSFSGLRQSDGISGFCDADESGYDSFITGHSSDSISLALGLAQAAAIDGERRHTVAVIGDGSLTGGMAYEGLDHAGHLDQRLIIVLNDNEMSINGNVGAVSARLSKLRSAGAYTRLKHGLVRGLQHMGAPGRMLFGVMRRLRDGLKSLLLPHMIFEELGFTYLGPVDGHDIKALVDMFRRAQSYDEPVLIHLHSKKGRGYAPAEQQPERYHGIAPFDPASGELLDPKSAPCYTDIFGQELCELAERDERIIAITAAMADGTGLLPFSRRWPQRFYDVGIAEQHALGFAAGLARGGKRPVVAVYSSFLQRAYDQILEELALQKLPVVLAVDRAGIVGEDGKSHQGIFDISYLRTIPDLTIMAPADGEELRQMLRLALTLDRPAALRYGRGQAAVIDACRQPLQLGKAITVREGADAALIACGHTLSIALEAAILLQQRHQLSVSVINSRFIAPLDIEALHQAAADCHGRLLTIEENVRAGGFGSACAEAVSGCGYDLRLLALPNSFIAQGRPDELRERAGLTAESVAAAVLEYWFANRQADEK
ncbi:MAG: 1-deoxy-D-xylulose-5-phosphate synthase [Bacillota bacterium]|nr:1-deoxy-D-xylulose-5-phosphate synthase [Bacillota bacterium]